MLVSRLGTGHIGVNKYLVRIRKRESGECEY